MINCCDYLIVFFFSSRRRHTRLVSDWSSDVCSSDQCSRVMLDDDHITVEIGLRPENAADVVPGIVDGSIDRKSVV